MTRTELLAVAKPILFNTEMVRAILDGRKTVTRRVIKPPAEVHNCTDGVFVTRPKTYPDEYCRFEPYSLFDIGDILYVRETWCKYDEDHVIDGVKYAYKADATPVSEEARNELGYKWKPSIHMPKEAARVFLRVTDVRVERLQEIKKMGVEVEGCCCLPLFIHVWNSTVKKSDLELYGWEANPWVWVIEFEKIEVTK